jgi:hypothetical protein
MDAITKELWSQPFYVYGMIVSDPSRRMLHQLALLMAVMVGPYCICSYFLSISITNSACILRSLSSFSYIPRNHGICWAVVSSAWLGPAAGSFGHVDPLGS